MTMADKNGLDPKVGQAGEDPKSNEKGSTPKKIGTISGRITTSKSNISDLNKGVSTCRGDDC